MTEAIPLLEAEGLTRHYLVARGWFGQPAKVRALEGVSFTLQPRRTLAVVGESGCGKSTLARQLALVETPTSGALRLWGRDLVRAGQRERYEAHRYIQMVFQNPYSSLNPRQKIGRILEEPLITNTLLPPQARREKVLEMMARVGLRPEYHDRYPHAFSSGQRQRIAIARALMPRPTVVVADEPVSALDVSIQAQVLNLLLDLQDEMGIAYVFVSHDLGVVRHIADEVLVMYLGRAVEHGPRDAVFAHPCHPYTRALLAARPRLDPARRPQCAPLAGELPSPLAPPSGCAFHTRCSLATDECRQLCPELRPLHGRMVACHQAEQLGRW